MKPRDTLTKSQRLAPIGLLCGLPFLLPAGAVHGQIADAREERQVADQDRQQATASQPARPRKTMTHNGIVRCVAFSPDGKTLASGNVDKTIHLWDVGTGKERVAPTEHVGRLTCLAFGPDGKTLASAGGPINLWDVQTGKQEAFLNSGRSVAFSPDGRTLAAAGQKTITLWDVKSQTERSSLSEQTNWGVTAVAFSPDGKLLASSTGQYQAANQWLGTVTLWDVASRQRLKDDEADKPSPKQAESGAEKGATAADDRKALQGTWVAVAGENSKEKFDKELKTISVVFKGDAVTLKIGEDTVQATSRLDPSKKLRAIDLTITEGPGKGEKMAGIYALEDGRLTICFGEPGQGRPTEFAAEGKPGLRTLLVLKKDR